MLTILKVIIMNDIGFLEEFSFTSCAFAYLGFPCRILFGKGNAARKVCLSTAQGSPREPALSSPLCLPFLAGLPGMGARPCPGKWLLIQVAYEPL